AAVSDVVAANCLQRRLRPQCESSHGTRGDTALRCPMFVVIAAAMSIAGGCSKPTPTPAQPPEVYVTPVIQEDVPVYLDLVGQTSGFQDIEIRARVEGFIDSVNFREGSFVHRGDLLYRIDPKPFEASLLEAKAEQEKAEAALEKTENDVARYTPLVVKQ